MPVVKEKIVETEGGGKKGSKLAMMSKIPPQAIWAVAERFGIGSAKYDDVENDGTGPMGSNWAKGLQFSALYDAMQRHAAAWWSGEEVDDQVLADGLDELLGITIEDLNGAERHLAAVAWHAMCLLHYSLNYKDYKQFDDRHKLNRFT